MAAHVHIPSQVALGTISHSVSSVKHTKGEASLEAHPSIAGNKVVYFGLFIQSWSVYLLCEICGQRSATSASLHIHVALCSPVTSLFLENSLRFAFVFLLISFCRLESWCQTKEKCNCVYHSKNLKFCLSLLFLKEK